jgi:uncharacterized protein (DUF305 family)
LLRAWLRMLSEKALNMKPLLFRTTLAAAALGVAVALAGCSSNDMSGMPGMSNSPAADPSSSSSAGSASTEFNTADIMFAQMMIPHHQQAVEMSEIILNKTGVNSEVTVLAKQIKAAQQPEITTMTSWLSAWGSSPMPSMSGMDHGGGEGMMGAADMKKLEEADGPTGQKLFLEGMIRHHQGAIAMAQTEISNGKNTDAVALARKIAASQQKEITTMDELLSKL